MGWATASRPVQTVALEALHQALRARRPSPGLVHHSDRGGRYASAEYQDVLDHHAVVGSMSRPGNCYDNAPVESFFHSLKDYIEGFYNRSGLHSGLGYCSPIEHETLAVTA